MTSRGDCLIKLNFFQQCTFFRRHGKIFFESTNFFFTPACIVKEKKSGKSVIVMAIIKGLKKSIG